MASRPGPPVISYALFCGGTIAMLGSAISVLAGLTDGNMAEIGGGLGGIMLSFLIIGFGSVIDRLSQIDWSTRQMLAKRGPPADTRVATRD